MSNKTPMDELLESPALAESAGTVEDIVEADETLASLRDQLLDAGYENPDIFTTKKQARAVLALMKNAPVTGSVSEVGGATKLPATGGNVRATWRKKREAMKRFCEKAPKVRMMIPLGIGERPGSMEHLQINGYALSVQKGVYVNLPEPFAKLVEASWQQQAAAGSEYRLDRQDPATGKPYSESAALQ